jgi:acyl-CoA thioester hydrolase
MQTFELNIRVYYEDTDALGMVYYANYLKFMERARTEWLRHLGFEQSILKQQYNFGFVVRHINVDYLKPAQFDDLLTLHTQLHKLGKASMSVAQRIEREGECLCHGIIRLAGIDIQRMRPQAFPRAILQELQLHE